MNSSEPNLCVAMLLMNVLLLQALMFAINASTINPRARSRSTSNGFVPSNPREALYLDTACQTAALRADLPGTYVAMVSTPGLSLNVILESHRREDLPIINTKVSAL